MVVPQIPGLKIAVNCETNHFIIANQAIVDLNNEELILCT